MIRIRILATVLAALMCCNLAIAGGQNRGRKSNPAQAAAAAQSVVGAGTAAQITKWTGASGGRTFGIGDSNNFENKYADIGIRMTKPAILSLIPQPRKLTLYSALTYHQAYFLSRHSALCAWL